MIISKINDPVYLLFLIIMAMGMFILVGFSKMLIRKDSFVEKLTDQQHSATETLSRLATLIEVLVNRGGQK